MKHKLLSVLIGITLVILLLCLLRSRVAQAILGLWLLGVFLGKLAENFLAGFRKGLGRWSANGQK